MTIFKVGDRVRYLGRGCQQVDELTTDKIYTVKLIDVNERDISFCTYCQQEYGINKGLDSEYRPMWLEEFDMIRFCNAQFELANHRKSRIRKPDKRADWWRIIPR